MTERTYTKGNLNVLWKSELCTHCNECWLGLPEVFNPDARPWVNLDGASSQEIMHQVVMCPSGALSIAGVAL